MGELSRAEPSVSANTWFTRRRVSRAWILVGLALNYAIYLSAVILEETPIWPILKKYIHIDKWVVSTTLVFPEFLFVPFMFKFGDLIDSTLLVGLLNMAAAIGVWRLVPPRLSLRGLAIFALIWAGLSALVFAATVTSFYFGAHSHN